MKTASPVQYLGAESLNSRDRRADDLRRRFPAELIGAGQGVRERGNRALDRRLLDGAGGAEPRFVNVCANVLSPS